MRSKFTKVFLLLADEPESVDFRKAFKIQRKISLVLIFLALSLLSYAEGSKDLMADTSCRAALCTISGSYAAYNSSLPGNENSRLYIHISNPATEIVYLGFSLGFSSTTSNILGEGRSEYFFRIKDPNGNIVYGPQAIDASNAIPAGMPGFQQIKTGPLPINGSGGYTPFTFTPAAGAIAGDYYIEFNKGATTYSTSQCSFDYWDITVANNTGTIPVALPGRIWGHQWGFYSKDYVGAGAYSGVFKGKIYSYTSEGFVNKIDFSNSNFRGGSFTIGMNSTGPGTSGNLVLDRQSIYNQRVVGHEFKLFVNDPDSLIYPTGDRTIPSITLDHSEFVPISCFATEVPIKFTITRPGKVEILIDFDGNGKYDEGSRDVILSVNGVAGINTIIWDKKDGQGNEITTADLLAVVIKIRYELGIHHLSLADIEYLTKGFTVTPVRPIIAAGYVSKFYWDDTQIRNNAGNNVPYLTGPQPNVVELEGATERKWDNFTDNSVTGFGNGNSINTWWNSYLSVLSTHFAFNECGILSVQNVSFSAIAKGNTVSVSWIVSDEMNVESYDVESGTDGKNFLKIAGIKKSDLQQYNVTDAHATPGNNYYRLKIISKDGSFKYSDVEKVSISGNMQVTVFPNPVTNYLKISFPTPVKDNNSFISITSADGKVMVQKAVSKGSLNESVDVTRLHNGTYFVKVMSGNESVVKVINKN